MKRHHAATIDMRPGWLWRELVKEQGLNMDGRLRSDMKSIRAENGNKSPKKRGSFVPK